MLLGSTANNDTFTDIDSLIIHLILQQRFSEVYELLIRQQHPKTASIYNMALCLHWSGNYQEALSRLESIQLSPNLSQGNKFDADEDYKKIKSKQHHTNDHLQGISEVYIKSFPALAHDAIVRLKTDCWLQLKNYAKVVAIATPIAHKGYQNILDALKLANTANDERI